MNNLDTKIAVKSLHKAFIKHEVRVNFGFLPFGDHRVTVEALCDVNLTIGRNRFVSIIGPSGCGKTTLLRIMHGLVEPTKGSVEIDGALVTGPILNVAMVFQQAALYPWRTLSDNVTFGLEARGVPKGERYRVAEEFISLVGLEGFEHHYPYELSGGMQQRAGLARALAVNPDVLLMDEPFGALDAQTRRILQEELIKIWERYRKTVVFITHDLEEAIFVSDEIVVMTRRPGQIKGVFEVDLPRPRSSNVLTHRRFVEMKDHLWRLLSEELKDSR
ncbi:MAG: ABC transporter ATP-binding protein [Candidatus Binatia bacterium]